VACGSQQQILAMDTESSRWKPRRGMWEWVCFHTREIVWVSSSKINFPSEIVYFSVSASVWGRHSGISGVDMSGCPPQFTPWRQHCIFMGHGIYRWGHIFVVFKQLTTWLALLFSHNTWSAVKDRLQIECILKRLATERQRRALCRCQTALFQTDGFS